MRRAITSLRERSEGGFTVVELVITMAVMAVVATAVTGVAIAAFSNTDTITNRRAVYGDGQVALDRLSKQLRQGEVIDASSSASTITFSSYVAGVPTTIVWRAEGTSAPYSLQESRDGGTNFYTVLDSLTSNDVFVYTAHGNVTDEVTITLSLGTTTSTSTVTTDVHLRNAQS